MRIRMPLFFDAATVTPEQIMPLTEKVVLGSAVCIIEGAAASLAFSLPKGLGFYIGGCLMLFAMCLAMLRFRTSKLGADIWDLYFYEFLAWCVATVIVMLGEKSTLFWYMCNSLLFLRLVRVYALAGSTTHDHGWSVFGISSYYYNKKHRSTKSTHKQGKMLFALLTGLFFAVFATALYQQLSDKQREAVPWALTFIYITVNGPILLRSLGIFMQKFLASTHREAADEAEKDRMRQVIEAMQTTHRLSDERAALLLAAFFGTDEKKRAHMVELAQMLSALHPTEAQSKT